MRLNLNPKWAVLIDEDQITLAKRLIVKEGKNKGTENLSPVAYWNNFEDAINGLIDRNIQGIESLELVESRISELKAEIFTLIKLLSIVQSDKPTVAYFIRTEKPKRGKK
jgi:hypothetical protein